MTRLTRRPASVSAVRGPVRLLCGLAALIGLVGLPAGASAQTLPGFLLERFNPAGAGSDWFVLESLDFRGEARPAIGLVFDWSQNPFVLEDANGDEAGAIVARQMLLHAGLSLNLVNRLRLGLDMPLAVHQSGEGTTLGEITYPDPDGAAAGDLRVSADLRLFGEYGEPVTLAIGMQMFFPTGKQEKYLGDHVIRIHPRLMAAGDAGVFSYAATFGFMSRDEIDDGYFQGYGIGHELFGGLALGIKPAPNVLIGAEIAAYTKLDGRRFPARSARPRRRSCSGPASWWPTRSAWRWGRARASRPARARRRFASWPRLEWFPSATPPDSDGDGILDDVDACPDTPGVRTDDPATTGCPPPPDRDDDGIIDSQDACPDEAGPRSDDPGQERLPAAQGPRRRRRGRSRRRLPRRAGRAHPGSQDQRLPAAATRPGQGRDPRRRGRLPRQAGRQDRRPQDQRLPRHRQGRHPRPARRLPRRRRRGRPRPEEERLPAGPGRAGSGPDHRTGEVQDRQRHHLAREQRPAGGGGQDPEGPPRDQEGPGGGPHRQPRRQVDEPAPVRPPGGLGGQLAGHQGRHREEPPDQRGLRPGSADRRQRHRGGPAREPPGRVPHRRSGAVIHAGHRHRRSQPP